MLGPDELLRRRHPDLEQAPDAVGVVELGDLGEVLVAHRCSESRTSNDQEGRGAAVAVSDTFASVVARVSQATRTSHGSIPDF